MTKLEVLYNGECPICAREIAHYESLRPDGVDFIPITKENAQEWGVTVDDAAAKLHARRANTDAPLTGVAAFTALWLSLPRYRWLGRFVSLPPVNWAAAALYNWVLAPALFAMHKRRQKRSIKDIN